MTMILAWELDKPPWKDVTEVRGPKAVLHRIFWWTFVVSWTRPQPSSASTSGHRLSLSAGAGRAAIHKLPRSCDFARNGGGRSAVNPARRPNPAARP